jgi:hypothetical protein
MVWASLAFSWGSSPARAHANSGFTGGAVPKPGGSAPAWLYQAGARHLPLAQR